MAPRRKKTKYTNNDIINAVAEVKNGSTFRSASEKYGVPVMTLSDKVRGRVPLVSGRPGPDSYLTEDQEKRLVSWLLHRTRIGRGVPRKEIPKVVKKILDEAEGNGYIIPEGRKFPNNKPSNCWIYGFLKRHPNISTRTPENLGFQRSYITEKGIRDWFKGLDQFLDEEHGIKAKEFFVMENGDCIFNCDESGFPLQGTNGKLKIISEKGSQNVFKLTPGTKEQITVLACASANGTYSKPLVIYPTKKPPKVNSNGVNLQDYCIGYTPNGWMDSDCFLSWITNCFYKSIVNKVQFPVILFLDGHASHIKLRVSEFCQSHDIILYCFPAHASHMLQPLDVSVFGPLKKFWNMALDDFRDRYQMQLTKVNFFKAFDPAWKQAVEKKHAISGFKSVGIVPFDPDQVNYSKLVQRTYVQPPKHKIDSNVNFNQKVGIAMILCKMNKILSLEQITLFTNRLKEGYDIEEDSNLGKLWQLYKEVNEMLGKEGLDEDSQQAATDMVLGSNATQSDPNSGVDIVEEEATTVHVIEESEIVNSPDHQIELAMNCEVIPVSTENTETVSNELIELQQEEISMVFDTNSESTAVIRVVGDTSCLTFDESSLCDVSDTSQIRTLSRKERNLQPKFDDLQTNKSCSIVRTLSFSESSVLTAVTSHETPPFSSSPIPSTSSGATGSLVTYDNYEFSPFKDYLRISDKTHVTEKVTKRKSKVPPAITGKDYLTSLRKEQERKIKELEGKESRKQERENKKREKEQLKEDKKKMGSKKKTVKSVDKGHIEEDEEDGNRDAVPYDDSSDDDLGFDINKNLCAACEGNEDWSIGDRWVGCNECVLWYHKTCSSGPIEKMTPAQLKEFEFICPKCMTKEKQSMKKRKIM